ncbi:hypothetical protein D3Z38_17730 [Clostridiales bacterium]|nr:hypothetical protein [Clostridiales bacterium]
MMDYGVFKQVISERIKDFLPPVFHTYEVNITIVRKINQKKEALLLMPPKDERITAMPNIYLDEMYEAFQSKQDIEEVLRLIAAMIIHYTGSFDAQQVNLDFKSKKDSIVMNLINRELNQELLQTVPHKDVMDLSIIYRIIMEQDDSGLATILVDNHILEELEISEKELEELAHANTGRLFPIEIFKLSDLLYVMTNELKVHGATAMMYSQAIDVLAEKIGGSFFVIPSSIHEIMAVPEWQIDAETLACMLEDGNRLCCLEEEVLSSAIYHYDKDTKTFTMAASYEELAAS